jgi:hypothetical protein
MLCPKCKIDHAHRSHRKGLERLVGIFGYYPYRCRECGHRFLHFRYASLPEGPPGKRSETEREIRSTRVRIRWKRKKRALLLYGFGALVFLSFLYYITRPGNFSGN